LALASVEDPQTTEAFIAALKDERAETRWLAADTLGQMKSRDAVKPLAGVLRDKNPGVRSAAAQALGEIGSKGAVEALLDELTRADSPNRPYAALALGATRDSGALKWLEAALSDKSRAVRRAAKRAIKLMKSPPPADRDAKLRRARNPWHEPPPAYLFWADEQPEDRRSVDQLIAAIADPDAATRSTAVEALRARKDPRVVPPLIRALQTDPSPEVRAAAAYALVGIRDPRAVEPLISALSRKVEPRPGTTREPEAVTGLISALNDEDKDVRSAVAAALKRITGMDFGHDYSRWRQWWNNAKTP
jgi:HEAT repeat protein